MRIKPKPEMKIVQYMSIEGLSYNPIIFEILNPPKWFIQENNLQGDEEVDRVVIVDRMPFTYHIRFRWQIFKAKVLRNREAREGIEAFIRIVNQGFEDVVEKYKDRPFDYIEMNDRGEICT